jgi:hypothetical protein
MKETFEDFYYSVKYRGNEIFDFIFKDLPQIIKNFWTFRKVISGYRWYGGHYSIFPILEVAIKDMALNTKEKGFVIDEVRLKRVAKMKRLAKLLNDINEDKFIGYAEGELGELIFREWDWQETNITTDESNENFYQLIETETPEEQEHNRKVFDRARKIEEEAWNEIWTILKGQDCTEFNQDIDWKKQFDGTGIRGWWD